MAESLKIEPRKLLYVGDTVLATRTTFKLTNRSSKNLLVKMAVSHAGMEVRNAYGDRIFVIPPMKTITGYTKGIFPAGGPTAGVEYSVAVSYGDAPEGMGRDKATIELAWTNMQRYRTKILDCEFKTYDDIGDLQEQENE